MINSPSSQESQLHLTKTLSNIPKRFLRLVLVKQQPLPALSFIPLPPLISFISSWSGRAGRAGRADQTRVRRRGDNRGHPPPPPPPRPPSWQPSRHGLHDFRGNNPGLYEMLSTIQIFPLFPPYFHTAKTNELWTDAVFVQFRWLSCSAANDGNIPARQCELSSLERTEMRKLKQWREREGKGDRRRRRYVGGINLVWNSVAGADRGIFLLLSLALWR